LGKVTAGELDRLRSMDAEVVLLRLADYAKVDATFVPIKSEHTSRWHVRVGSREFELLLNGHKYFDTRQKRGGGGAIDLTMHLFQVDFKIAVNQLRNVLAQGKEVS
jgi:hypothetical protein